MGKIPRKSGSEARKRKRYTMQMKHTVYAWRKFKNMRLIDIQKECKETFNLHVADTPRDDLKHICNQCRRQFQDYINLTLHMYWHSWQDEKEIAIQQGLHVADDLEEEDQSLCQPMDQAVLNSVNVSQKMSCYFGFFEYCENYGYEKNISMII